MARVIATAVAGVDPSVMGLGPIPATRKVLDRAGLAVDDLDLVELNEAFASQSIACIRELGLDPEKVNVNGGAIAIGHPLGMSGARLVTMLAHELERRDGRYGLATMCIGVGQGIATIIERTDDPWADAEPAVTSDEPLSSASPAASEWPPTPAPSEDVPWDRPAEFEPPQEARAQTPRDEPAPPAPAAAEAPWDVAPPFELGDLEAPRWDQPARPEPWDQPATATSEHDATGEPEQPVVAITAEKRDAASMSRDPYDENAPVLSDVTRPVPPSWPTWNGNGARAETHTPAPATSPTPPSADCASGPTPPDDLFTDTAALQLEPEPEPQPDEAEAPWPEPEPEPAAPWPDVAATGDPPAADEPTWPVAEETLDVQPRAWEVPDEDEPLREFGNPMEPDRPQVEHSDQPLPVAVTAHVSPYSTSPTTPTNLLVRIELALVDEGGRISAAERARPVGPTAADWAEAEPAFPDVTPRDPQFDPRTHQAEAGAPPPPVGSHSAPGVQSPFDSAWYRQTDLAVPSQAPTPAPAPWGAAQQMPDPLAGLIAAPFIPPAKPAPYTPAAGQVVLPESVALPEQVALADPVALPEPVAQALTPQRAAPAVDGQPDVWFLATEPQTYVENEPGSPAATPEPSSLMTVGLTIGVAIVVIVLVLVFIQLMTSLLR
jgi:hypothetical protein